MISDITLGQYFPGFSQIHKLDPRTKIILSTIFIVTVFIAKNLLAFLLLTAVTLLLIPISKISFRVIFKAIKPLFFILLFTSILNLFMTGGEGDPLVDFWIFKIYREGIIRAIFMSVRVVLLIIGTSIFLTYTTSPISLTDGLESLLTPLKWIHVPVHIFAMMMTIALRFIPTLVEETEKIINAQKSRGADFSSGNLVSRAKALIPLIIPLFASSFKRAEELAVAMECRCYSVNRKRTKLVKLSFSIRDGVAILFMSVFLALIICANVYLPDLGLGMGLYEILSIGI